MCSQVYIYSSSAVLCEYCEVNTKEVQIKIQKKVKRKVGKLSSAE